MEDLSTWMGAEIAEKFWDKMKILGIADGTYIYVQCVGSFLGNKEL